MGITLVRETGKYRVYDFVSEHCHLLHFPECAHMMPSQRKITDVQAFEIELADNSGLTQKASYDFFGSQAGGRTNLGFIRLDQKNYLRNRRQRDLEYGEVGSLLVYFQTQALEDPSFFYAMQLDSSEQITNIFWANSRMLVDYALFGDVISFDTTFSTNKEYRPLGVFVGFNNHRGLVIFGATLLYDETAKSFSWLFETFLKAHKFKKPKTIFTDQDAAMAKALCEVIPDTRHGLCTWHIMQNGIKHLGNLMKDGSYFLRDFKKLMFEYEDESKFEDYWNLMLSLYKVKDNSWLKGIYKLKEKWARCYMKTAVTLGMRSTQLSESLNRDLKDYLKSDLDLNNFFKHFERVVNDKRYNELQAEYNAREKLPRMRVKTSPLLKQAGQVYTPLIFELFQEEWEKSLAIFIKQRNESNTLHEYLVSSYGEDGEYTVIYNLCDQMVSCSCKKFESSGFLCCHALKILDIMDIKLIPQAYIVKRWTREARDGFLETTRTDTQGKEKLDITHRYRELCPQLVKLATKASDFEEGYAFLKKAIKEWSNQLDELRKKRYDNGAKSSEPQVSLLSVSKIMDQINSKENLFATAKGLKKRNGCKRAKRLKSWVENQPRKKKKVMNKETLHKEVETAQSLTWVNYEYGMAQANENVNSFTQLLHGSLNTYLVPQSSQASNHDQSSGGTHQQMLGGFSLSFGQAPPDIGGCTNERNEGSSGPKDAFDCMNFF